MNTLGHNSPSPWTWRDQVGHLLWAAVESTLFRFSPRRLHAWRRGLLRLFGARLVRADGPPVRIYPSVRIYFPWNLELHPGVMLGPRVQLYNLAPITLHHGVNISQDAHLCSGTHDYTRWTMPLVTRPIVVGPNTWIAAEAFIGPGVTIGELCVVGARSVVVHDQPPQHVCAGNPCRPLKPRVQPT